jgi:hypothetical protein
MKAELFIAIGLALGYGIYLASILSRTNDELRKISASMEKLMRMVDPVEGSQKEVTRTDAPAPVNTIPGRVLKIDTKLSKQFV